MIFASQNTKIGSETVFGQRLLPHFKRGRICYDLLPQAGHAHPGPSVDLFRGGVYKTRPLPQRAAALTLTAALLTGAAFPAFAGNYYIEDGSITISAGTEAGTNKVEQTGRDTVDNDKGTVISSRESTASRNTVTINAEKDVEVTLKDLNIDGRSQNKAAVSVTGNGATTIELDGDNKLKSGSAHAGLEHNKTDTSGELIIQDNNKDGGSLKATGGQFGAGIGGAGVNDAQVKITGGKITATGGEYGAGIGGGFKGSGDVTISGGEIHANGGSYSAGIGGGDYSSGKVTISGGEINATGGYLGAGIGGGEKGSGDVTISGGEITANGGSYGAGIGGGKGVYLASDKKIHGGDGKVTITGGKITATSKSFGAGIGGGSTGGGSTGGDSTGGDSTGGDSADVSVQESVFPGLVVTGKDGQRTSYTSIRGNNILSLRVGRFTASFRISLSTLRQLRAEGIDTITFQTILCSTTLSVDELLALGGEDTPVALAHSMGTARLTVGGADHSELLK